LPNQFSGELGGHQKAFIRAGLDPAAISEHSARVGMAQDLVAGGADLVAVMRAGR
jgi:site-specific recombinase XerD